MTTTSKNTDVEAVACCCNGSTNAMFSDASVRAGADGNRTSDSSASNRITAEPRETCSVVPKTLTNTQTINVHHYARWLMFRADPDHVCRSVSASDLQSPG